MKFLTVTAIAAATLAAAAQDAPKPPQAKDRFDKALRIAVVNLADCFDDKMSERWAAEKKNIEKIQADFEAAIVELEMKVRKLREGLQAMTDKKSELYFKKLGEHEQTKAEIETKKKVGQVIWTAKALESQITYYEKFVQKAISAIAAEQKLDLVLRLEEPRQEEESPEVMMRRISSRVVLSFSPTLDVTKDVLDRLNGEYKKEKPAAAEEFDCPKCKAKKRLAAGKCETCGTAKP